MNKKKSKKKIRKSFLFIKAIIKLIDKKIIIPITKVIVRVSEKFARRTDKFEKILVRRNTLIFISLLLAIIVFISIENKSLVLIDSYAEVLHEQNVEAVYNTETYVVEGLPETADVTLIGRKSDIHLAKIFSKGTISVDLSQLKEGSHRVSLNYQSVIDSLNYNVSPSNITVFIYPKVSVTKTAIIDIINRDTLDSKLSVDNVSIDKDQVIIKGAEHTLDKVATVRALVDISKIVEQDVGVVKLEKVPLIAYDNDGKTVDVEMVPNNVNATINVVSPKKELPIKVIPEGEVEFGKAIGTITTSETKITVYGNEDVLRDMEYFPIKVDVSNLNKTKTFNINVTEPTGIRSASIKNIKVTVSLGEEKVKEIKNVMIETVNLDKNYKAAAIGIGSSAITTTVVIKGTEDVLKEIDETKIKAIVDLSGYKEGDHEIKIMVSGEENRVVYEAKTNKIKIRISKK